MEEPSSVGGLFKGRHFDNEIIVLCVRWYLTFKLSSRDLVQMMTERGIVLPHTTILRWVQRYVPDFGKRWNHYARPVGGSWRVDETYLKIKGRWVYLYRAVDKADRAVDFLLSKRRDIAAAKRFFSRAVSNNGTPRVITLDGYAASHRAVAKLKEAGTLPRRVRVRSCKYLNNVIEQDHRRIKQPTVGLQYRRWFDRFAAFPLLEHNSQVAGDCGGERRVGSHGTQFCSCWIGQPRRLNIPQQTKTNKRQDLLHKRARVAWSI
jgi:transposase-like protein